VRRIGRVPLQGPTPQDLARIFEGAGSPEERLRRLVSELAAFYQRGGAEQQKALTEAARAPGAKQMLALLDAARAELVRAALEGMRLSDEAVRRVVAITSFAVWQAFLSAGLTPERAALAVADTAWCSTRTALERALP
jgi:hypothetical protein